MKPWLALACILVVAAALRLPGVEWGFGVEPGVYHQLHPDESVSCFALWTRGRAWLDDAANWHERGMQVECWALASVLRRGGDAPTLATFVRMARVYSVFCGLLGILVIGLVARELDPDAGTRDRSGLCAALLCALAGAHIVTSFWARGQIQDSVCFFTSVYLAQRSLGRATASRWLFLAGGAAGVAIGLRWSIALLPMLGVAALASRARLASLGAAALGVLVGFAVGTAFVWTPPEILTFIRMQTQAMLSLESRVGLVTVGAAAVVCTVTGCGLATSVLGVWALAARAAATVRTLASLWRRDAGAASPADGFARAGRMARDVGRSVVATPAGLLFLAIGVQLALVALIKSFEARHTDLLSTALAAVAGVQLAHVTNGVVLRRRLATAVLAATFFYQAIYACGVLARFTHDTRNRLAERIGTIVPRSAPLFVSWYVPGEVLTRSGFTVTADRRAAAYAVVSDQHALRYLGPSGTFLMLGMPASCREVYNCWSEEEREFYQALFRGPTRIARRFRAAAWTPEFALYRRLMGSKWMFTADLVVFALPGVEQRGE